MDQQDWIEVWGARVHNLKNIDARIPRHSLSVITGLSGSGKSSLAFDTLYAEGQRRYIETFSAYARNFLDNLERPDVDKITGLSPVISIEQKTTNKNPRSTVGTVTEIYDFLRLLFARAGTAYSYVSGEKMVKYTEEKVVDLILERYDGHKVYLLAPLVRSRKGHYRELFESVRKKGFLTVRVDGELKEVVSGMKVDRYKNHDIEVVVDKLAVQEKDRERLEKSVHATMQQGQGLIQVLDNATNEARYYSKLLMDPVSGISYREPAPNNFSFNSAQGACPKCKGLGYISVIDREKVVPNPKLSIRDGGLAPLGKYRNALIFWEIEALLLKYDCTLKTPIEEIPDEAMDDIFNGTTERLHIPGSIMHTTDDHYVDFDGLVKYIRQMADAEMTAAAQKWAEQFSREAVCPTCHGQRLNLEALSYRIDGKNISELSHMDISQLYEWLDGVEERLDTRNASIAHEICKELRTRLKFLLNVGLDYLSLSRATMTLSGGESQRIRLATQIGSQLVNVLYILDEPSIGLHQRDNVRLIDSLKELRDIGNTVVVVEHDKDMMLAADYIVDMGPRAGRLGGEVVYQGTPKEMLHRNTMTADYLNGQRAIEIPAKRRKGNGNTLRLIGAKGNNLKGVKVDFPLGTLICVTGVSGSGKSTLINDTLLPILSQHFYRSLRNPLEYEKLEGIDNVDKVVAVDQSPLGRTPRSNPATYTGVFSDIRNLFVELPEAKMRGYKPGRFSFNVKGGRCETCKGNGYKTIEMNILPDVYVPCEECHGKRYNRETLEVRYKGKSISDVLDMTINNAVEFFENVPTILHKIKVLQDVGLGYIKLGQSSTTLSGGESQRVKLATELSKRDTGQTIYILDEPTTGLHFEDIRVLLDVLNRLVERGNTVIVIEHNLDIIKAADYLIDMGPDGGRGGGVVVATGTPEKVVKQGKGYTAKFLKEELEGEKKANKSLS
ncbi:excinuclease ABC [Alloprevotella rava F0323]|uniref:UvrABC system protein A n=1 Tax=Alloprevotella rava F0323 TaxID=679199 RepID=G5GCJ7_9BACT|nr:excinuclease ABC subunit UvrA [Alloprevotella rava]EHG22776.1 excinuclease ABC [Alloprevotella rava F0323]